MERVESDLQRIGIRVYKAGRTAFFKDDMVKVLIIAGWLGRGTVHNESVKGSGIPAIAARPWCDEEGGDDGKKQERSRRKERK